MAAAEKKTTYTAAEVAALESKLQQLLAENDTLKKKLDHMSEILANAQRARFGQSSEKRSYVMKDANQVSLFNEAEAEQDPKAPEPTEETFTVVAHTRKKKRTMEELTAELPVEEVVIELPEDQRTCDKCGGTFVQIGKKFVSQQLIIIPRQCRLVKYYSCTYACKKCETDTGYAHIVTTVTPPPSDEALPGLILHGGGYYGPEVCGRLTVGQTGEDLAT